MVATPMLALIVPPLQAVAIMLPILLCQDVSLGLGLPAPLGAPGTSRCCSPGGLIGRRGRRDCSAAYVPDAAVRLAVGLIGGDLRA